MDKEQLLKIIGWIESEIEGLGEHGDIPSDSHSYLNELIDEAKKVING